MSHDDHHHAHDDSHDSGAPSEHEVLSRAMQELLEEKGVISAEQVRRRMELFDEEFPQRGARVIAHAWVDPAFRKRLLDRKSTRLNSSHANISYAVFCLKKKK